MRSERGVTFDHAPLCRPGQRRRRCEPLPARRHSSLRHGDSTLSPEIRALLTIGFCGGYTTFSTFSYETVALLEDGEWGRAGLYVGASVILSLVGTFLGFAMAREVIALRERI